MSTLKGAPQLRARLKAIKQAFKPVGRAWAESTVEIMRPQAPSDTGKGRRSIRVRNASMRQATVAAIYYMRMQDQGTKAHDVQPRRARSLRFEVGGQTVFAKKAHVRGVSAKNFASKAAREALRRNPMAESLIAEWNRAA